LVIQEVVGNAEPTRHLARRPRRRRGAARPESRGSVLGLLPGRGPEGDPDHLVPGVAKERGGHGAVHAATESYDDGYHWLLLLVTHFYSLELLALVCGSINPMCPLQLGRRWPTRQPPMDPLELRR